MVDLLSSPATDDASATQAPAGGDMAQDPNAIAAASPKPEQPDFLQTQEKPDKPVVPDDLKAYTRRWLEETGDTPEFRDACRQYEEDIRTLFPGDERNRRDDNLGSSVRRGRRRKSRAEEREVNVARIYRSSQQTLALVCPYNHSARWTEVKQVPKPGGGFSTEKRDQVLQQFARSVEVVEERYSSEAGWANIVRAWVLQSIWFRASVLKVAFHRDFGRDPISGNRAVDEQEGVARLHFLMTKLMRGEISTRDAEFREIQAIQQTLAAGNQLEVFQGLNLSTIPLPRYKVDGRVRSYYDLPSARWKGEEVLMTGQEILERWPYTPNADGTWDGVHPEDLTGGVHCNSNGNRIDQDRIDAAKKDRASASNGKDGKQVEEEFYLVKEIWSRIEGKVLWLIDGVEYPISTWVPPNPPPGFFPYYERVENEQEGTWYGRSSTELAAPIQARINRKQSDEEKARWLSMGGRGVYDKNKVDGESIQKIGKTAPGSLLGLDLQGKDIKELVMWFTIPFNKESFDHLADDDDLRLILAIPEQAMGVTDAKTTATAIRTAQQGSAATAKDRQDKITEDIRRVKRDIGMILIQEVRPDEAEVEGGPWTFWPKIYDKATAKKAMDQINAQVHAAMVQQEEQAMVQAAIAGQPYQPNEAMLDQQIAQMTEKLCVEQFGLPRPLTREELYRRLDVQISVSIDGKMDAENRVTQITNLLEGLVKAGMPATMINFEPLGRLIAALMGEEDDMSMVLKPDPNLLVQTIAQIAQTDPSQISPESAGILAKLGILAAQYLQQQAAAAPQPGAGAPAPGAPAQPKPGTPPK